MTLAATGLLFLGLWQAQPVHGSTYVPLDSWVYPVFNRLSALGYIPDAESLARPWTRTQCVVLAQEAADMASRRSTKLSAGQAANEEALRLISALEDEFFPKESNRNIVRIESIYTRFLGIGDAPLRDSYHFGQTLANDYGRPYSQGANTVAGLSGYATLGRFSAYFRGEYQNATGAQPLSATERRFIAQADQNPQQAALPKSTGNRFDPLEMYIGAQLGDFNVTFGKQSAWWGPGQDSAFHFSNNAEPLYMLRLAQTTPIVLPGLFRHLGRIRGQFLVGHLAGHYFPSGPFLNAQKITLQLTPDFELGFSRSAIFGGTGHPLTVRAFARSLFSTASTGSTAFGAPEDPGDRRSGFDFRWHLPGLKRYVTIYSDSLADDDPNPLANPRRAAWGPGIYIAQFPGLRKLDFRLETYSTWLYAKDQGGQFIYWNDQYHDAYTNDGFVLGSWVGRDARAYNVSSTYWFSARNRIGAEYRQIKASSAFLPGGGTQSDASVDGEWQLHTNWQLKAFAQYERYFVPVLGPSRRDFTGGLQITFWPQNRNWTN